jgi:hypothetical protein
VFNNKPQGLPLPDVTAVGKAVPAITNNRYPPALLYKQQY